MRAFEYASPTRLAEALTLIGENGDRSAGESRPLAGGTDLLTLMKADLVAPARLVDIKRVAELDDAIDLTPDGLAIGALATLAQIDEDPLVRERCPALAEAAALAASPQLRNMATIGGNLLQRPRCWYFRNPGVACWLKGGDACPARDGENGPHALFGGGPCYAVHPSDLATALVALDAAVRVRGAAGERTLPLEQFFALPAAERRTENGLGDDELILGITIPRLPDGARSTYLKAMDRKTWAFALVGVAAVVALDAGRIAGVRLVLGGVAPIPWRVRGAEQILLGEDPTPDLFARAADAALADAEPLGQNGYKIPLARALIRRALSAASQRPPRPTVD
jgi:xanthine dehydrogenase YagS FAD-binding subunit